jgi:N-methylhydantoinase A
LQADHFLGGTDRFALDANAGMEAVDGIARALDASREEAALGVLRVANATMERALRRISVERGHDPRNYTLVAFGGAGPLHACALAEALGMKRVLVPPHPGVLSAFGLCTADVVRDAVQAVLKPMEALQADPEPLQTKANALADQVRAVLPDEPAPQLTAELDMRYAGQSYELTVPLDLPVTSSHLNTAAGAFQSQHEQRYGYSDEEARVEAVALRIRGRVAGAEVHLPTEPPTSQPLNDAKTNTVNVWFDADAPRATPLYERSRLHHGHAFDGPAVIVQYDATVVVPPNWHATVDAWRNLIIER